MIPKLRDNITFSELKKLFCCCSVTKSCLILLGSLHCSMPGFPVLHHLPEFAQTHVHWFGDAKKASWWGESGKWKSWLRLNIQKKKIKASGTITSWEIDEETVETVSDFIFLGSKITTDGDCNHEIKRRLLLGRKVMTNLDSIFKSRDVTLPTKVRLV